MSERLEEIKARLELAALNNKVFEGSTQYRDDVRYLLSLLPPPPTQDDLEVARELLASAIGKVKPIVWNAMAESIASALSSARVAERERIRGAVENERHGKALHQEWSQVHHDTVDRILKAIDGGERVTTMGLYECNTPAQAFNKTREDAAFAAGEQAGLRKAAEIAKAYHDQFVASADREHQAGRSAVRDSYMEEARGAERVEAAILSLITDKSSQKNSGEDA